MDSDQESFSKQYLSLFNLFLDKLEKTNNQNLIFHATMLYDRLQFHFQEEAEYYKLKKDLKEKP